MTWLFLFLASRSFASPEALNSTMALQNQRAKILMNARNIRELNKSLYKIDKKDEFRQNCQMELELKKVPVSCYSLSKYEKVLPTQIQRYDRTCDEAVLTMNTKVVNKNLSAHCQKLVSKRNREIEYSME